MFAPRGSREPGNERKDMRKVTVMIKVLAVSLLVFGGCGSDDDGGGGGGDAEETFNLTFEDVQWGYTLIVEQGQSVSVMRSVMETGGGGGGGEMIAAPAMTQASGPFKIAYYLSADEVLDMGSDSLMSPLEEVSGIEPGASLQLDHFTIDVPAGFPTGTYNAFAVLDFEDDIEETDETDNIDVTYSAFKLEVVEPASRRPDLYAAGSTHHSQVDQGASEILTMDIGNCGAVSSEVSCTGRLYLSQDYDLDPGDELLTASDIVIPALAAGEGFEFDISFTVPSSISGSAFFVFDIDAGDDVSESVEMNNEYHMTTTVNP